MVISSRSALFSRRGWLSKNAPASVVMSIRKGFNLPFCPLALSRKGHVSSTANRTLPLAKGSSQYLVEHPIVGERAPSRHCARYGVEAGGFLSATIAMTSHQRVPPRHATPSSCLRSAPAGGPPSCLLLRPPGIPQISWCHSPALP